MNDIFQDLYIERDVKYFNEIDRIISEYNISNEILLKNYMSFIRRREFSQSLAYYELYKLVENIPGSIIEIGVYLGNGLFTWSKLLETFIQSVRGRMVFGFDSYDGYISDNKLEDEHINYIKKIHGHNFASNDKLVERLLLNNQIDNLIAGVPRVKLYNGDVKFSIDYFIKDNPGIRISLLMLDLNLYEPTKLCLDKLYSLIPSGGCVCFRGYGVKPWEGESRAVDEFLIDKGQTLNTFNFSSFPSAYFIKN